jgi:hypothetical protein
VSIHARSGVGAVLASGALPFTGISLYTLGLVTSFGLVLIFTGTALWYAAKRRAT